MKHFINFDAISDLQNAVQEVRSLKKNPFASEQLGKHKTLGMLFF